MVIVFIFEVFTLCGFQLELGSSSFRQKLSHFIFGLQLLLLVFSTFYSVIVFVEKFSEESLIDIKELYYASQPLLALFVQCTIIFESCVQRTTQRKFWLLYQIINECYARRRSVASTSYLIKFFEYFLFYFLSFAVYNTGMSLNKNCFRILMLICRLRFFYYQFYVEVINFELSVIEKEAKKMFETSMNDFFGGINNPFELQRLKWIREYYAIIQKMSVFVMQFSGGQSLL